MNIRIFPKLFKSSVKPVKSSPIFYLWSRRRLTIFAVIKIILTFTFNAHLCALAYATHVIMYIHRPILKLRNVYSHYFQQMKLCIKACQFKRMIDEASVWIYDISPWLISRAPNLGKTTANNLKIEDTKRFHLWVPAIILVGQQLFLDSTAIDPRKIEVKCNTTVHIKC